MKRKFNCNPILTITGSDSVGGSGIQADIKTISALGGYAASAITAVTIQDTLGIQEVYDLPVEIIRQQIEAVMEDLSPKVIKIGMLRNKETMWSIAQLLDLYRPDHVILDPGIVSSHGDILMERSLLTSLQNMLFSRCSLVSLKCEAAAYMLERTIRTNEEMVVAAKEILSYRCQAVFLQGSYLGAGTRTDLLLFADRDEPLFFSSSGLIDYNSHGAGGALSSAIATFMAEGHDMKSAVTHAREYVNRLVVYSLDLKLGKGKPLLNHTKKNNVSSHVLDLYNRLMDEVTRHIRKKRDVLFYADMLNITPRYLAEITMKVSGKSPKELISEHLVHELEIVLDSDNRNIQEISYLFGFPSQAQMAKFFKKMTGCTPSEYRRKKIQ